MKLFTPTMNLRFIERENFSHVGVHGELLSEGFSRVIKTQVLQQLWVNGVDSTSEWRDVPLHTPKGEKATGSEAQPPVSKVSPSIAASKLAWESDPHNPANYYPANY